MGTRLDRALEWWRERDGVVPNFVYEPLKQAGLLRFDEYHNCLEMNDAGLAAQQERGWKKAWPGGWWERV